MKIASADYAKNSNATTMPYTHRRLKIAAQSTDIDKPKQTTDIVLHRHFHLHDNDLRKLKYLVDQ